MTDSKPGDRDTRSGRFLPGNKASPGRKKRETEHEYFNALMSKLDKTEFGKVIDALIRKAKSGDTTAIKLLLDYSLGKPVQKSEISGGDQPIAIDWKTFIQSAMEDTPPTADGDTTIGCGTDADDQPATE